MGVIGLASFFLSSNFHLIYFLHISRVQLTFYLYFYLEKCCHFSDLTMIYIFFEVKIFIDAEIFRIFF